MSDRKLRVISEAIDTKNYKQALKLSNAFLQKTPNSAIAKALKALTLVRSGKSTEALSILDEIKKTRPPVTDESTLSTIYIAYRSLGKVEEATACYENAARAHPQNEDLAQGMFFSYVREFNPQKQKQAAMELQKQFGRDKYIFWSIVSTLLQVPSEVKQHMLLTVAERMIQKFISDKKLTTTEEVLFYLELLERQERYQVALEVLETQKALFKMDQDLLTLKATYLTHLNRTDEAITIYKELLELYPGEYSYYLKAQDLMLTKEGGADTVRSLFSDLRAKEPHRREPFLAEAFLESKLLELGASNLDRLVSAVSNYVNQFGNKTCCFLDIKELLPSISSKIDVVLENINPSSSSSSEKKESGIDTVTRLVTRHKMRRALGFYNNSTRDEIKKLANELFDTYLKTLKRFASFEDTENTPVDDYLLLAANLLVRLYINSEERETNIQPILDAILVMEKGLLKSKFNYKLKLATIDLYSFIGSFNMANELFETLDTKHIQRDTLSYVTFDSSIRSCSFSKTLSIAESIQHFHNESKKELPELATLPYRHGGYTKVKEFVDFKDRLERSHQLAIAEVESLFAELSKSPNHNLARGILKNVERNINTLLKDEILASLQLNQDYSVLEKWDDSELLEPKEFLTSASFYQPFETQKKYLKIRVLLLSLYLHSLSSNSELLNSNLSQLVSELSSLGLLKVVDGSVSLGFESLSSEQLHYTIYYLLFDTTSKLLLVLASLGDETLCQSLQYSLTSLQTALELAQQRLISSISISTTAGETPRFNPFSLPHLSSFASVFSWTRAIASYWDSIVPPARKKKRPTPEEERQTIAITELKSKLKAFDGGVKGVQVGISSAVKPLTQQVTLPVRESWIGLYKDSNPALNKLRTEVSNSHKESLTSFLQTLG